MREAIEAAGIQVQSAELMMVPKTIAAAEESAAKKLIRLIEALAGGVGRRAGGLGELRYPRAGAGGRRLVAVAVEDYERVHAASRPEWRTWLAANHASSPGVWLVSWKRSTGKPRVGYDAAVEEAPAR